MGEAWNPWDTFPTKNSKNVAETLEVAVKIRLSPSQIILLRVGELFEESVTGGADPTPAPMVKVTVFE